MDKLTQIAWVITSLPVNNAEIDDSVLARAIGTMIYDIPMTRSGLVSQGLLDEYGFRPALNKCCNEHYHSRQQSGLTIIEMLRNVEPFDTICNFLREATTVHLTTSAENTRLSTIQNHPSTKNLDWTEQHALAGIKMVRDPGTMPRKMKNKMK